MGDTAGSVAVIPWQVFVTELVGTAVLVLVGPSLVILMFGEGSPIPGILPSVQHAREANHGGEAVSLRQRPRQAVSPDG